MKPFLSCFALVISIAIGGCNQSKNVNHTLSDIETACQNVRVFYSIFNIMIQLFPWGSPRISVVFSSYHVRDTLSSLFIHNVRLRHDQKPNLTAGKYSRKRTNLTNSLLHLHSSELYHMIVGMTL
jgi:hypothetical protein